MINSINTLEVLKPKLITMDKFNSTTTTKLLPPSLPSPSFPQTRTFVTFGSHLNNSKSTTDINKQNQERINGEIYPQKERVEVQHLENHTKLQNNNCWNNFRTLYNNLSASSGNTSDKEHITRYFQNNDDNIVVDVINVEQSGFVTAENHITNNIQSKSAFKLDLNKMKYHNDNISTNKKNNIISNGLTWTETINHNDQLNLKQMPALANLIVVPSKNIAQPQRTEDQNNAFRHIESVHNYAKLKSYEDDRNDDQSPHGSRHSSYLDDEEDDEEDDEDENDDEIAEEYDNDDIDLELSKKEYPDNLDADYESIFNRSQKRFQKLSTSSDGALFTRIPNSRRVNVGFRKPITCGNHHHMNVTTHNRKVNDDEEEAHIDVDVETVETQSSTIPLAESLNTTQFTTNDTNAAGKPDHHARRPMNAFLIFCKRHRAIVKERYNNLENRAITKILGDWWASLDTNDKKCFTNLAQQNKDAFFSANPNFKWYKLPAPPLRTLTTRPGNGIGQDYQEDRESNVYQTINNNTRSVSHNNNNNYFKLADEAQMGDLSQLMQEKSKASRTQQTADLQQALSETSQFMSTHITGTTETLVENNLKRRFYNENSFSSNSSEEDNMEPKKKSARSCKGKRYQELINSGQIVTAIKKSKSSTRLAGSIEATVTSEINLKQNFTNINNNDYKYTNSNNVCQKRSVSESENIMSYELNGFDLEERIKELPALDLDEYLQRKRNTKKKKKFSVNGKKRGQRSNNNNNCNKNNGLLSGTQQITNATTHSNEKQCQQSKTAVGSQKRKARKESITRRDISVIEQEVAPLLPITINGCCYFQDAPTTIKYVPTLEKDIKSTKLPNINVSSETSSSIIPQENRTVTQSSLKTVDILMNNSNTNITRSSSNNKNSNNNSNVLNDNISSSTSDLLILAEVAANSTELKH